MWVGQIRAQSSVRRGFKLAATALAVALAGCGTPTLSQNRQFEGSLPRLIGIAGSAPICLIFCFVVTSYSKEGDEAEVSSGPVKLKDNVNEPSN
jgi:hypothetical protein